VRAGWPIVASRDTWVLAIGGGHGRPRTNTRDSFGSWLMHIRPKPTVEQPGSAHCVTMRTPAGYPTDTTLKRLQGAFLYSMQGR